MRRFHPILNEDGRISIIRVCCIVVVILSLFAAFLLKLPQQSWELKTTYFDRVQDKGASKEAQSAKTTLSKEQLLVRNRAQAMRELEDGARFFRACGSINQGFEGCSYSFSNEVAAFFDSEIEAADDGFSIVLKAKDLQKEDLCVRFSITSQSDLVGSDAAGRPHQECTFKSRPSFGLNRVTDHLQGNPAPSGRARVIAEVADHHGKEDRI